MKKSYALLLAAVIALLCLAETSQLAPQEPEIKIRLQGIDRRMYDSSEMAGNVLLVSFGATWCTPCIEELKALEELTREYKSRPVKIMWVSIEGEGEITDSELRKFAKSVKITFPVLRDLDRDNYAQFSARQRIPLVVFFDKNGQYVDPPLVGMSSREAYKNRMRGMLERLLSEDAPAATN